MAVDAQEKAKSAGCYVSDRNDMRKRANVTRDTRENRMDSHSGQQKRASSEK
jgi:hypothetical protein